MHFYFKNKINTFFVAAILILVVLGCDAGISLKGRILDEQGNPVANAKIVVEQGKSKIAEQASAKNGSFDIQGNICPMPGCSSDIKLTVSKDGYQTYEKILSEEELEHREIDVVLNKN